MRDNAIKLDIPPEEERYRQEQYDRAQKEMDAQTANK
jgi:hypothetical protein